VERSDYTVKREVTKAAMLMTAIFSTTMLQAGKNREVDYVRDSDLSARCDDG
jgi:hypothetical protein